MDRLPSDVAPYRAHRQKLLERLRERSAAGIFATGEPRIRNHDCDHRFRPDSDFWWMTGFAEPSALLVLRPGAEDGAEQVLFLNEKNREEEVWTGIRLGTEAAPAALGVDRAIPLASLWEELPPLLEGFERVVYRMGLDEERDRHVQASVTKLARRVRQGARAPLEWLSPQPFTHELRLIKDPAELELMRRAAGITAEAHRLAMAEAAPGRNEAEIDALLDYTFRRNGSTGQAYNNIVAGGANACILHYVENRDALRDGDLLLIDAGAEYEFYASDVTRTFPVNGTFSAEQRALYDVVLDAQKASIDRCRPGNTFESAHDVAVRRLVEGLVHLGLLEGDVDGCIEEGTFRRFYMHKTGHWLGLDVHDCGAYHIDGDSRPFAPGMVTTVEPGLYVAPDDETVDERWRGIGIRIEDDVLVTAEGHEVLTADVPKEVDEVEAACAQSAQLLQA